VKVVRRVVLPLLLALVTALRAGLPEARPAYAAAPAGGIERAPTAPQASDIDPCDLIPTPPSCVSFPPPELLYLRQGGLYAATPAQTASLRALENEAVAAVLTMHNLPLEDDATVRTWGRDAVLAQLYVLLVTAIDTAAEERTTDQQNVVDWATAVAKRQNVAAAVSAAREYVKWAGLGRGAFDTLMASNPTKAQIEAFLSGTVVNFDNTNTALATEGWCKYRSPAPYESEYDGYNVPICLSGFIGFVLPPTPTYDELVKWGAAKANYPLLSTEAYLSRSETLGLALGIAAPVSALVGGYSTYLAAAQIVLGTARYARVAQSLGRAYQAASMSTAVGSIIAASIGLVVTLIAAIVTAVLVGINVTDAANLPGKLATLVDTARTTTPDAATLISSTDSTTSLIGLFIGATTPTPSLRSCDNSLIIPGMVALTIIGTDQTTLSSNTPCLNPTRIPAAAATDPQFVVKNASGIETLSPTIAVKDADTDGATVARLSNNWFITSANGTTAQTLRLAYTDWDGKQQNAWLIGTPTDGYAFLTFSPPADASAAVEPDTCEADGACGASPSLKYIGADGQKYSATVRPYLAATGTPTFSIASESNPVVLDANGFAPGGAVAPVTYRWSFKVANCNLYFDIPCPEAASATGATVTYTWDSGGTYQVDLTATDAQGAQATATLQVPVATLPPTLAFAPDCATSPSVPCNTWSGSQGSSVAVQGTLRYTGSASRFQVTINWGDGSTYFATIGSDGSVGTIPPGGVSPLTITRVPDELAYTFRVPYTYANPGVYNGSVTVQKVVNLFGDGGTVSKPFTINVRGNQAITFPSIGGSSYGSVFTISATGGASGQPVTFTATAGCVLSNISGGAGTGSATVTVTSAGFCDITASQAGSASYNPAPDVRRRVDSLLASLTVTAPSPTIAYGQPLPALSPSYDGFRLQDTAATLITPVTCAVAANSGTPGTYPITCQGATARNYSVSYEPGTLTIEPGTLTITASDKTMTYGGPTPSFDASVAGLANGDTASVISGLVCAAQDAAGQPVSSSTPAGTYPITCSGASAANYTVNYAPGTLTITKASTSTALSASPSATVFGQPVAFTAQVTVVSPGSGTPSGAVSFTDGGSVIAGCAAQPLSASGIATCTTAALSVGLHEIGAAYSGDANFASGTPASLSHTVAAVVVTRRAPTLSSGSRIEGPLWLLNGETMTINGATIAGDLLVPGSPTVVRNSGTVGTTVAGSGSTTPSGYRLTLNSGANVARLLTRTDAVALPSVPSVPVPTGTRDVQVNSAGQSLGNLATLRNLTLNSGAGAVSLPAGTYGRLTANNGTSFVLGVAGASTPSVYNLQGLTLNGGRVTVVGPVVINLASGFSLNSGASVGGQPSWLTMNVATGLVQLNSNTAFFGTLRAPASSVTLNSGARLEGMLFADRLALNGGTVRATP
jgi:hypothetical protein